MIGFLRKNSTLNGGARSQSVTANLESARVALRQATDPADIRELKSRVKALRRELRSLPGRPQ